MNDTMKKILRLMKEEHLGVISSLGPDGQPQSAVVGFSEDDKARLVVGTSKKSRKYQNIMRDPRVSVVIGWDSRKTIQYEGKAHETYGDEHDEAQELHIAKHPQNLKFKDAPVEAYIVIEPMWIRYTDVSTDDWKIEELKEFA